MSTHSASTVGELIQVVELLVRKVRRDGEEQSLDVGVDFGEGWWFDDIKQMPNGAVLIRLMDVTRGYGDDGLLGEAHQDNILSANDFLDFLRKFPSDSRLEFTKYWFEEKVSDMRLRLGSEAIALEEGDVNILIDQIGRASCRERVL